METDTRRSMLPIASLVLAALPIALGLTSLFLFSTFHDAATRVLMAAVFRVSCAVFGSAAVVLAVLGLKAPDERQRTVLLLAALGLGLGETLPIWWVIVQFLLGLLVLLIGLLKGLKAAL